MSNPIWQFAALLAVHWFGDFYLQSHWMSVNKSKRFDALAMHVGVYTAVLLLGAFLIFGWHAAVLAFVALNGGMHFATDFVTSRITSRLWREAFDAYGGGTVYPPRSAPMHDFFVVVGVDQYLHQLALAATMWWLL